MSDQGWAPPDSEPARPQRRPVGPAPGYPPARPHMNTPSGLFPSGPPRPMYREPLPVRAGAVSLGAVGGLLWMMLFGLMASSARSYAWLTIVSGVLAWLVALVLGRFGDRGAAVGVAVAAALGLAVAAAVVVARWVNGQWLLW
jgi:hypothetical protein